MKKKKPAIRPRDFPNDLLHELDKMDFFITETQQTVSLPARLDHDLSRLPYIGVLDHQDIEDLKRGGR